MAYFAVFATDRPGTTRLRADTREAHRRHLREPGKHRISVQFGGPTFTHDGTRMNGTLLVIAADSMDAVHAFLADDPYIRAGLFDAIEIRPWHWSLGNSEALSNQGSMTIDADLRL